MNENMKPLEDFINEAARQVAARKQNVIDCKKKSNEDIISHFKSIINIHYDPSVTVEDKFYGGITNDIEANLNRHKISGYLTCVEVDSYDTAKTIERLLHTELGVYIGKKEEGSAGRGGNEDSTIVYLADRKSRDFVD